MVSKRDCLVNVKNYLESLNIQVNIAKNAAQGHKGFFSVRNNVYRIDISRKVEQDSILRILVHEFAHYLHFINDNSLRSLDFILGKQSEKLIEELIELTVASIPSETVKPLFEMQATLIAEIAELNDKLFLGCNRNEIKTISFELEKKIKKTKLKYLLNYDRVKIFTLFGPELVSINDLQDNSDVTVYLKLKSKKRALKRVNSRMNKLNKYYNTPTELFARSFEYFIFEKNVFIEKAPTVYNLYLNAFYENKFQIMTNFVNLFNINFK